MWPFWEGFEVAHGTSEPSRFRFVVTYRSTVVGTPIPLTASPGSLTPFPFESRYMYWAMAAVARTLVRQQATAKQAMKRGADMGSPKLRTTHWHVRGSSDLPEADYTPVLGQVHEDSRRITVCGCLL